MFIKKSVAMVFALSLSGYALAVKPAPKNNHFYVDAGIGYVFISPNTSEKDRLKNLLKNESSVAASLAVGYQYNEYVGVQAGIMMPLQSYPYGTATPPTSLTPNANGKSSMRLINTYLALTANYHNVGNTAINVFAKAGVSYTSINAKADYADVPTNLNLGKGAAQLGFDSSYFDFVASVGAEYPIKNTGFAVGLTYTGLFSPTKDLKWDAKTGVSTQHVDKVYANYIIATVKYNF